MAQLLRCKSCGYVGPEGAVKDVCPACGVPRRMLEPYTDPVSEKRRKLLELDIHPIVVHFPVAFAVSGLVVALFAIVFPEVFRPTVTAVLKSLVLALPFVGAGAIATGMLDGKTRFRKLTTPFLKRKIFLGSVFVVSALAALALTFVAGPLVPWVRIADAILLASCVACSVVLGRIGGRLMTALFPG